MTTPADLARRLAEAIAGAMPYRNPQTEIAKWANKRWSEEAESYAERFLPIILAQEAEREQEVQRRVGRTLRKVRESEERHHGLHWSEVVNIFGQEFCDHQTQEANDARPSE